MYQQAARRHCDWFLQIPPRILREMCTLSIFRLNWRKKGEKNHYNWSMYGRLTRESLCIPEKLLSRAFDFKNSRKWIINDDERAGAVCSARHVLIGLLIFGIFFPLCFPRCHTTFWQVRDVPKQIVLRAYTSLGPPMIENFKSPPNVSISNWKRDEASFPTLLKAYLRVRVAVRLHANIVEHANKGASDDVEEEDYSVIKQWMWCRKL